MKCALFDVDVVPGNGALVCSNFVTLNSSFITLSGNRADF